MSNRNRQRVIAPARALLMALVALAALSFSPPSFTRPVAADDDRLAGIPKAEYRARRQKLMEQIKDGIIVLVGAREEDFGEVGRFRQRNDFMYLTGVQTPAAYVILVPAGVAGSTAAQEILFIPARNLGRERWTGVQIGPGQEAEKQFGIQQVASSDKLNERLRELLAAKSGAGNPSPVKIYTIIQRGHGSELTREHHFVETIKRDVPGAQLEDVARVIAEMRKVKSQAEMAVLQKAIGVTGEAHRDVARTIKPGVFEYEAQAALEYAFARNGAERPGFPSIVGSGFYSTILHYNENRKKIEAGDTVVVDIGAEYSYYTADITRTYPASGKFTPRQREVYQLVLDAQRAAERAYKPGMTIAQLNRVAIDVMKASKARDKQGNTLERYFIHGLGHWLGMDVHDVGSYGPAPVGSVFTIEPGIYIPEENLGVRIEDDYLVTETGLVKLSRNIPSEIDEVERMMTGAKGAAAGSGPQK